MKAIIEDDVPEAVFLALGYRQIRTGKQDRQPTLLGLTLWFTNDPGENSPIDPLPFLGHLT